MFPKIEIAVQDIPGVRTAKEGGADRVELCVALGATGGLTPSASLMAYACHQGLPVHPLLRPHPGGYELNSEEVDMIAQDISVAARAGASGVVVGALTRGSRDLDLEALGTWGAQCAQLGLEMTVHRCVDVLLSAGMPPGELMDALSTVGCTRVLTSGGAPRVGEGLSVIASMVEHEHAIEVQAGGGLRIEDIPALVAMGMHGIHASAKTAGRDVGPSGPGGHGLETIEETDPGVVAAIVLAVKQAREMMAS